MGAPPKTSFRMATSTAGGKDNGRPMTSVRAAGYSSRGRTSGVQVNTQGAAFDPFGQGKNNP